MKFIIEFTTKNSGRIGCLIKNGNEIKTPLVLHYTKVGSIPHISREVFDLIATEMQGVQLSAQTTLTLNEAVESFQRGIAAFAGLEHTLSYMSVRDTAVESETIFRKDAVVLASRAQNQVVTMDKFMDFVINAKPDLFHTLCDGVTDHESPNKRIYNAVSRTKQYFENCALRYEASSALTETMLIAPVEGGFSKEYRKEAIKVLNAYEKQDTIGGYFLDGFHLNSGSASDVDHEKVAAIVAYCNELLPEQKLKVMFGAYTPALIIQLVRLGVDVFDTTFAYLTTTKKQALTFNFDIVENASKPGQNFAIDLSDTQNKDQFVPFVSGCTCLACKKYTRAYTHHLLNTSELLGPILLMIHNTHHYLEFFKVIRQCIANDTLGQLEGIIKAQEDTYVVSEKEKRAQESTETISNKKQRKLENAEQS